MSTTGKVSEKTPGTDLSYFGKKSCQTGKLNTRSKHQYQAISKSGRFTGKHNQNNFLRLLTSHIIWTKSISGSTRGSKTRRKKEYCLLFMFTVDADKERSTEKLRAARQAQKVRIS